MSFNSQLNIEYPSAKSWIPGTPLNLTLHSEPNSTVYLLAVDRSVNLLKTGNNIDKARVYSDMKGYNVYQNYRRLMSKQTDNDEARYNEFEATNMFIMTNANKGRVTCVSERSGLSNGTANQPRGSEIDETPFDDINEFKSITRKEFPETWIFDKVQLDSKGIGHLETKVPDTMTSWDISGFTIQEEFGLGIAKSRSITVKQMFFIMMNLPYSIRVGEILKVEVHIFNYYPNSLKVQVTLFNQKEIIKDESIIETTQADSSDSTEDDYYEDDVPESKGLTNETQFRFYDGILSGGSCNYSISQKANYDTQSSKVIHVKGKSVGVTHFFIKPLKQGRIQLKVRASLLKKSDYDEVIKTLKVEYDGHTEYENAPMLINLKNSVMNHHSDISIPEESIKKSFKIGVSIIGDLNGPALVNTDKLM